MEPLAATTRHSDTSRRQKKPHVAIRASASPSPAKAAVVIPDGTIEAPALPANHPIWDELQATIEDLRHRDREAIGSGDHSSGD